MSTEYEVRYLNKQGMDGGITVEAEDVTRAMAAAYRSDSGRYISKITAVLPWDLINWLKKND